MGAGNRSAISTLVERRTRYLILVHVPTGRPTAEAMREGIRATLGQLPAQLRRTLTWDQGKELAMHQQISEQTGTRVFFCDAPRPGIASQVACQHDLAGGLYPRVGFLNSGSRAGFGCLGCGFCPMNDNRRRPHRIAPIPPIRQEE